MKMIPLRILLFCLVASLCYAHVGMEGNKMDTQTIAEPAETERLYTLRIYWAWNTGDGEEQPEYTVTPAGILEEGIREAPNTVEQGGEEGMELLPDYPPPGGTYFDFRGVSPGDALLTMRTTKHGQLLEEETYTIRVYDDLRLAVLSSERMSYR